MKATLHNATFSSCPKENFQTPKMPKKFELLLKMKENGFYLILPQIISANWTFEKVHCQNENDKNGRGR